MSAFNQISGLPAPPRHHARNVVVGDFGDELVLSEIVQHHAEPSPQIGAREMLPVLDPISRRNVLQPQRGLGLLDLRDVALRPLAFGGFYFFGFPSRGGFRGPVKSMTSPVKIEVPVGRARPAVEGHGESFRVCAAMNLLRSASANILRVRRLPWPMATYLSAPEAMWPLSVLTEQPSLAAACAALLSPSRGEKRSLRAARSCRLSTSPLRYARKRSGNRPG